MGNINLSSDVVLKNVPCVPEFSYNLLSISKLLSDSKCQAVFTPECCSIQALNWTSGLEIGKQSNNLYLLSQTQLCLHSSNLAASIVTCAANVNKTILWHHRLGHVPYPVLKLLPIDGLVHDISPCDCCMLAKQTRQPFPTSVTRATAVFELFHIDLWGPYRHKTHSTCTMFLTIVDDKSKTTWVYLMSDKSQAVKMFTDFIHYVETHFSTKIKVVRSDNGSEFLTRLWPPVLILKELFIRLHVYIHLSKMVWLSESIEHY